MRLRLTTRGVLSGLFRRQLKGGSLLPLNRGNSRLLIRASCFDPPVNLGGVLLHVGSGKCRPILTRPRHCTCVSRSSCQRLGSVNIGFRVGLPSVTNVCNGQVGGGTVFLVERRTVTCVKASVRDCDVFRGFVYADIAEGMRGLLSL